MSFFKLPYETDIFEEVPITPNNIVIQSEDGENTIVMNRELLNQIKIPCKLILLEKLKPNDMFYWRTGEYKYLYSVEEDVIAIDINYKEKVVFNKKDYVYINE